MKKIIISVIVILLVILIGFVTYVANKTVRVNETDIPGFTPIKNDILADKYCPYVISNSEYGFPYAVYYRASVDDKGNTYIAYHYFWEREVNNTKGFVPWLSRNIYTGGLKLQKIMFGKHDIEVIGLVIDKKNKITKVIYESPENYNPNDFSVKHKTNEITQNIILPLRFKVGSWNHLFQHVDRNYNLQKGEKEVYIKPQYFTQPLWDEFTMFKKEETALKQNRAHYPWEREFINE